MPVHDWTRVEAGIFHAFQVAWISEMQKALNGGLLPEDQYALIEQHGGQSITNVLMLHPSRNPGEQSVLARRRSLAIRHVSGQRLVALIEIVSPANKNRPRHVEDFAGKVVSALDVGVNMLVIDLFPPGRHDPNGRHGVMVQRLEESDEPYDLPANAPLTLTNYAAGPRVEIVLEHLAVGAVLPDMPLFLRPDRYVRVPLESTYQAAYEAMPAFWREVLEGRSPHFP
jgi:hypothetical protein